MLPLDFLLSGDCNVSSVPAFRPEMTTQELAEHLTHLRDLKMGDIVTVANEEGVLQQRVFVCMNYPLVHCTFIDEDGDDCSMMAPHCSIMTPLTQPKYDKEFQQWMI